MTLALQKTIRRVGVGVATLAVAGFITVSTPQPAMAASTADCGIWLCLPTGFPQGCSDSLKAFKKRIRKFKPPLPNLLSCTGGKNDGTYEMGYERFEACPEGYSTRDHYDDDDRSYISRRWNQPDSRTCIKQSSCKVTWNNERVCTDVFRARPRSEPYYIDVDMEGQPEFDRYWYSR